MILVVCLSSFSFDKNQTKNIPLEMTIQGKVHYIICSVHFLLQYTVSVTYTNFSYMDMTIALKALNEMQQSASMRLNIIPNDITVIYVTYFQMYYYLMQVLSLVYGLPKDHHKMRFVDCTVLHPHSISHIKKCVSFPVE